MTRLRLALLLALLPAGCTMHARVEQELPPVLGDSAPPPVASVEAKL